MCGTLPAGKSLSFHGSGVKAVPVQNPRKALLPWEMTALSSGAQAKPAHRAAAGSLHGALYPVPCMVHDGRSGHAAAQGSAGGPLLTRTASLASRFLRAAAALGRGLALALGSAAATLWRSLHQQLHARRLHPTQAPERNTPKPLHTPCRTLDEKEADYARQGAKAP